MTPEGVVFVIPRDCSRMKIVAHTPLPRGTLSSTRNFSPACMGLLNISVSQARPPPLLDMSNLPLGDDLKEIFDSVTADRSAEPIRAILVQNESGVLRLVESLPPEGTDREDFSNVVGKLFTKEPERSGYVLYRLDSKSASGVYEWLNCAYRPENAKVREKMQYAVTQASLFQGLSEQHFLETIYGATSKDFTFPDRLRNARKHDYRKYPEYFSMFQRRP